MQKRFYKWQMRPKIYRLSIANKMEVMLNEYMWWSVLLFKAELMLKLSLPFKPGEGASWSSRVLEGLHPVTRSLNYVISQQLRTYIRKHLWCTAYIILCFCILNVSSTSPSLSSCKSLLKFITFILKLLRTSICV